MVKIIEQYKGLRKEIYVLLLGRIVTNMGAMVWPMLTLILSTKLNMSASNIASIMLAISILSVPMNIVGGKLADKYNKKYIIVLSDLLSIIGFFICAVVPLSIYSVFLMVLSALLQSLEGPVYDSLTADLTLTRDRNRTYSLSYLCTNIGMVLAPVIGGLLINKYLSIAFFINGSSIMISTILIGLFVKDISVAKDKNDVNIYEEEIESASSTIKYIFNNRVILLYMIYAGIAIGMYCQWNYLLPLQLGDIYGDNGSILYGTMSSLNCVVVIICTAFVTRIIGKINDPKKMIIADSLELFGFLLFALFTNNIVICYISIFVFTIGEIINTIVSTSYLTKRIPASHRGRLLAVTAVFNNLCVGLMDKGSGIIYDTNGVNSAWCFVIVSGVVAVFMMFIISKWDKKDYKNLYND